MIVYEMCVLFFKMVADLRTWDENCVDKLCNLLFSHYLLGTMVRCSANDEVWEHITGTLNSHIGKAFMKRGVIRKFKAIERSFGVLKVRFPVLNIMPNFKQTRQRYVIVVYCVLHNFIRMNNWSDELFRTIGESVGKGSATNSEGSGDVGALTSSATQRHVLKMSSASKRAMGQFRDNITDTMRDDYVVRDNVR